MVLVGYFEPKCFISGAGNSICVGNFCWCILVGTVLHFVEGVFLMYIFVFLHQQRKKSKFSLGGTAHVWSFFRYYFLVCVN